MQKDDSKCVVLTCNSGFLNPTLFVCDKLLNITDRTFDIIICSGEDLSDMVPDGVSFRLIDTDSFTRNLPQIERLKQYTYWRIPAIESLSDTYEKILYLDSDIYISDPQFFSKIFDLTTETSTISAVRDVHQITKPRRSPRENENLGLPWAPYFNAGVLLIHSGNWRKHDYYRNIANIAEIYRNSLFCHDQSLLNLASGGEWTELSPAWNWQYSRRNCYHTEALSPVLIHFAGRIKLWDAADGQIPRRYWDDFRAYQRSATDRSIPGTYPHNDRTYSQKWFVNLLKNLWYFGKQWDYIRRFETPLHTVNHRRLFELELSTSPER